MSKNAEVVDKKQQRSSIFSAKTEYACVAMLELARHHQDPNPIPLKTISEVHTISHRFLVQILLQLKTGGLVESVRGAAGGYRLAREPDRISVADILNVIDPPDSLRIGNSQTAFVRVIHEVWADVQSTRRKILETTSLADLLLRSESGDEVTFQI